MADKDTPQLSEAEKAKAREATLADYEQKIAEAKLKQAQAERTLRDLDKPVTEQAAAAADEAIASSRLKTAQAEQDLWKGPDVKATDGKITATGNFIENRILASLTLFRAFTILAGRIKTSLGSTTTVQPAVGLGFVIHHAPVFNGIELYGSLIDQLTAMEVAFKAARLESETIIANHTKIGLAGGAVAPLLVGYAIAGAVRSIADIVSYFKQSTAFNNIDLPVEDTAMVAAFSKAIRLSDKTWKVYHPAVYPVNTIRQMAGTTSDFSVRLASLRDLNNIISVNVDKIKQLLADLNAKLAAATLPNEKDQLSLAIKKLTAVKEDDERLQVGFTQLLTMLGTADATTGIIAQAGILRTERLVQLLRDVNVYVVKIAAVSTGSNKTIERTFRATTIEHSGGTEINCMVFEPGGSIIFADSVRSYIPYKSAADITETE
ncbi:MAG: hypothetical protein ABWZ25_15060 [Chitinophagaceae bacterium]